MAVSLQASEWGAIPQDGALCEVVPFTHFISASPLWFSGPSPKHIRPHWRSCEGGTARTPFPRHSTCSAHPPVVTACCPRLCLASGACTWLAAWPFEVKVFTRSVLDWGALSSPHLLSSRPASCLTLRSGPKDICVSIHPRLPSRKVDGESVQNKGRTAAPRCPGPWRGATWGASTRG